MEFKRQMKTADQIPDDTTVRFGAEIGRKVASPSDLRVGHVAVGFQRPNGVTYISFIHYAALETPVEKEPEPPAPQYTQTNWYLCSKTGNLYYYSSAEGWYICVNNMAPPLSWYEGQTLKRLYWEA